MTTKVKANNSKLALNKAIKVEKTSISGALRDIKALKNSDEMIQFLSDTKLSEYQFDIMAKNYNLIFHALGGKLNTIGNYDMESGYKFSAWKVLGAIVKIAKALNSPKSVKLEELRMHAERVLNAK
jgi:hypothetical protein